MSNDDDDVEWTPTSNHFPAPSLYTHLYYLYHKIAKNRKRTNFPFSISDRRVVSCRAGGVNWLYYKFILADISQQDQTVDSTRHSVSSLYLQMAGLST